MPAYVKPWNRSPLAYSCAFVPQETVAVWTISTAAYVSNNFTVYPLCIVL